MRNKQKFKSLVTSKITSNQKSQIKYVACEQVGRQFFKPVPNLNSESQQRWFSVKNYLNFTFPHTKLSLLWCFYSFFSFFPLFFCVPFWFGITWWQNYYFWGNYSYRISSHILFKNMHVHWEFLALCKQKQFTVTVVHIMLVYLRTCHSIHS